MKRLGFHGRKAEEVMDCKEVMLACNVKAVQITVYPYANKYELINFGEKIELSIKKEGSVSQDLVNFLHQNIHPMDQAKIIEVFRSDFNEKEKKVADSLLPQKCRVYCPDTGQYETFLLSVYKKYSTFRIMNKIIFIITMQEEEQEKQYAKIVKDTTDEIAIVNITKDRMSITKSGFLTKGFEIGNYCYSEKINQITESVISPEDKEIFHDQVCLESLRKMQTSEKKYADMEFKLMLEGGKYENIHLYVSFYNSQDGDSMCVALIKNLQKSTMQGTMDDIINQHYETTTKLFCTLDLIVDGEKNKVLWSQRYDQGTYKSFDTDEYSQYILQIAKEYICTRDKEYFLNFFEWRNLCNLLKNRNQVEVLMHCKECRSEGDAMPCYRFYIMKIAAGERKNCVNIIAVKERNIENGEDGENRLEELVARSYYFDVIIRVEIIEQNIQYIKRGISEETSLIDYNSIAEFVNEFCSCHIIQEDRMRCKKILTTYLVERKPIEGRIPQVFCRYKIREGEYHWGLMQIVNQVKELSSKVRYLVFQDMDNVYGAHQMIPNARKMLKEQGAFLGYAVVRIDPQKQECYIEQDAEGLLVKHQGSYSEVYEEWLNYVVEGDKEWFQEEMKFLNLWEAVKEGPLQKLYQCYVDGKIEWIKMTFLYQDSPDLPKYIFSFIKKETGRKITDESEEKCKLLRQKRYYDDIIRQYEDRMQLLLKDGLIMMFEYDQKYELVYVSQTLSSEFGISMDKQDVFIQLEKEAAVTRQDQEIISQIRQDSLTERNLTVSCSLRTVANEIHQYTICTHTRLNQRREFMGMVGVMYKGQDLSQYAKDHSTTR